MMNFAEITLDILFNILFILSIFKISQIQSNTIDVEQENGFSQGLLLAVFVAVMLGTYDIGWEISYDRENYASYFLHYANYDVPWNEILFEGEWLFNSYMKALSFLGDPQYWLLCTAFIYTFNYYIVARRVAPENVYILLLAMVSSFCFIGYGTNTIRAGFALSFVLVGFSYYQNLFQSLLLFFIAYNIHHSTAIPIAAFFVAKCYDKPKFFYSFWFICVALSAVAGGYFTTLFSSLGQDFDNRVDYLTTTETHYHTGFRIDFILYSFLPIIIGYIYQNRLNYNNSFYTILHSTYVISNAFWVLVIRANFSDRFAYLSWFMYALVMVYPLLDQPEHFENAGKKLALTLLFISGFTYYMYLK